MTLTRFSRRPGIFTDQEDLLIFDKVAGYNFKIVIRKSGIPKPLPLSDNYKNAASA
jgi:hypothetical protein